MPLYLLLNYTCIVQGNSKKIPQLGFHFPLGRKQEKKANLSPTLFSSHNSPNNTKGFQGKSPLTLLGKFESTFKVL